MGRLLRTWVMLAALLLGAPGEAGQRGANTGGGSARYTTTRAGDVWRGMVGPRTDLAAAGLPQRTTAVSMDPFVRVLSDERRTVKVKALLEVCVADRWEVERQWRLQSHSVACSFVSRLVPNDMSDKLARQLVSNEIERRMIRVLGPCARRVTFDLIVL